MNLKIIAGIMKLKLLFNIFVLLTLSFCSTFKPIENNNLEIVKDILGKKEISETDKKIISKIIDSKIKEDKEEKNYIETLEKESRKDGKKIVELSRKSGQVDFQNKIIALGLIVGAGFLLYKFRDIILPIVKRFIGI